MNVILHNFPGDGKRMCFMPDFQFKIIIPITIRTEESYTKHDLIYRFSYHDGTYYHYTLHESEYA